MRYLALGLRVVFVVYLVVDLVLLFLILLAAANGETEGVILFAGMEHQVPLGTQVPLWGLAVTALVTAGYLGSVAVLFYAIHLLLGFAQQQDLHNPRTGLLLRRMGKSLVALWAVLILIETVVPVALFASGVEIEVDLAPLDVKVVLAIVGAALWLVARLADDAQRMREELDHVI